MVGIPLRRFDTSTWSANHVNANWRFTISTSLSERLESAADASPYSSEAFGFVLNGMLSLINQDLYIRPIEAEDLCWTLRNRALEMFGDEAQTRLAAWGVRSTEDFGGIAHLLVEHGLIPETRLDSMYRFANVYEFDSAFSSSDVQTRFQFTLPVLFLLTTVVAIFVAGTNSMGLEGGITALFGAWLACIGGVCVFGGIQSLGRGKVISVGVGVFFLVAGLMALLYVIAT